MAAPAASDLPLRQIPALADRILYPPATLLCGIPATGIAPVSCSQFLTPDCTNRSAHHPASTSEPPSPDFHPAPVQVPSPLPTPSPLSKAVLPPTRRVDRGTTPPSPIARSAGAAAQGSPPHPSSERA